MISQILIVNIETETEMKQLLKKHDDLPKLSKQRQRPTSRIDYQKQNAWIERGEGSNSKEREKKEFLKPEFGPEFADPLYF